MTLTASHATAGPRLLWTYVPLVAFVILSLPLLIVLLVTPEGNEQRDVFYYVGFLFICFGPNLSFVVLYIVVIKAAKKEMPSIDSVRTAMWSSLAAMLVPIGLLWLFTAFYLLFVDINARGAAVGLAMVIFVGLWYFIILNPILGLIGWFVVRRKRLSEGRKRLSDGWRVITSRLIGKPIVLIAFIVWCVITFSLVFSFGGMRGLSVFIAIIGIGILFFLFIAAPRQHQQS